MMRYYSFWDDNKRYWIVWYKEMGLNEESWYANMGIYLISPDKLSDMQHTQTAAD